MENVPEDTAKLIALTRDTHDVHFARQDQVTLTRKSVETQGSIELEEFIQNLRNKQTPEQDVRKICRQCGKVGSGYPRCSRCQRVYYCSAECQRNNWSKHKSDCKPNQERADRRAHDIIPIKLRQLIDVLVHSDNTKTGVVALIYMYTEDQVNFRLFYASGARIRDYVDFTNRLTSPLILCRLNKDRNTADKTAVGLTTVLPKNWRDIYGDIVSRDNMTAFYGGVALSSTLTRSESGWVIEPLKKSRVNDKDYVMIGYA